MLLTHYCRWRRPPWQKPCSLSQCEFGPRSEEDAGVMPPPLCAAAPSSALRHSHPELVVSMSAGWVFAKDNFQPVWRAGCYQHWHLWLSCIFVLTATVQLSSLHKKTHFTFQLYRSDSDSSTLPKKSPFVRNTLERRTLRYKQVQPDCYLSEIHVGVCLASRFWAVFVCVCVSSSRTAPPWPSSRPVPPWTWSWISRPAGRVRGSLWRSWAPWESWKCDWRTHNPGRPPSSPTGPWGTSASAACSERPRNRSDWLYKPCGIQPHPAALDLTCFLLCRLDKARRSFVRRRRRRGGWGRRPKRFCRWGGRARRSLCLCRHSGGN